MAAGDPAFAGAGLLATDLGTDWEFQSGDPGQSKQHVKAPGGDGDTVAEITHDTHVTGTESYIYNGSATDYGSATTGALDAAGALPGCLMATANVIILSVEIDYSPCANGKREVVKFTYSRGATTGPHNYHPSLTTVLATKQENTGVPALFANTNAPSKCQTASYTIKCEEGRDLDASGEFLAGACYGGEESVSMTHVGLPALTVPSGWQVTTSQIGTGEGAASNVNYTTHNTAAAKKVTRTATP